MDLSTQHTIVWQYQCHQTTRLSRPTKNSLWSNLTDSHNRARLLAVSSRQNGVDRSRVVLGGKEWRLRDGPRNRRMTNPKSYCLLWHWRHHQAVACESLGNGYCVGHVGGQCHLQDDTVGRRGKSCTCRRTFGRPVAEAKTAICSDLVIVNR